MFGNWTYVNSSFKIIPFFLSSLSLDSTSYIRKCHFINSITHVDTNQMTVYSQRKSIDPE